MDMAYAIPFSSFDVKEFSEIYPWAFYLWYLAVGTGSILLTRYWAMASRFKSTGRSTHHPKIPPTIPHLLPLIGSVPWQYFRSPIDFFRSSYYASIQHPIHVKIFTKELYAILGRENVVAHLAQTTTSNTIFNAAFLRQACAMSEKAVERLGSEDEETPKYFERKYLAAAPLYAWSSSVIHRYLAGSNASQLSLRFQDNLRDRFQAYKASLTPKGAILGDFVDFFSNQVTAALLDSMCGQGLLERNPSFTSSFHIFCDNLPTYMKRVPRFLARQAYKAREEVLNGVADWQKWASESYIDGTTPLEEHGDDKFWGSKFFRERYITFVYDMGFDARDIASMEVGFLFGASANVTVNTYWCAIEVFKDPTLLKDIRQEVSVCELEGQRLRFDIGKLLQQPLLQAVFAESLRLHCHNMFIRKTTEAINIRDWIIPKDHFAVAWSTPGHMDPIIWTKANNSHAIDTFWPGRFLEYPEGSEKAQFSIPEKEGAWLPFGSGANLCPGRHFAKIHCIVTLAMMVESFDCDILCTSKDLELDLSKFGMGLLGPKGKVNARIKRRGN